MTKKIVVPVEDQNGLQARLSDHFGRAPYFVIMELDETGEVSSLKTISNHDEHFGGRGHAHDNILREKPDVLAVYGMGPRGLDSMAAAGVTVLRAEGNTVQEVLSAYKNNKLEILGEDCHHSHGCH
ncbi:MAG: NifB/NifX family molybdenum-iron cluster-binding protein [Candidatus Saccharicenans sp.]|uniref:NifB/NifX family molybdenum-iron cluster-binding protein n=1 Tax=Candidatus Saccharicenans sp. TaxID=2819258 RepID=UPI00404B7DFC